MAEWPFLHMQSGVVNINPEWPQVLKPCAFCAISKQFQIDRTQTAPWSDCASPTRPKRRRCSHLCRGRRRPGPRGRRRTESRRTARGRRRGTRAASRAPWCVRSGTTAGGRCLVCWFRQVLSLMMTLCVSFSVSFPGRFAKFLLSDLLLLCLSGFSAEFCCPYPGLKKTNSTLFLLNWDNSALCISQVSHKVLRSTVLYCEVVCLSSSDTSVLLKGESTEGVCVVYWAVCAEGAGPRVFWRRCALRRHRDASFWLVARRGAETHVTRGGGEAPEDPGAGGELRYWINRIQVQWGTYQGVVDQTA